MQPLGRLVQVRHCHTCVYLQVHVLPYISIFLHQKNIPICNYIKQQRVESPEEGTIHEKLAEKPLFHTSALEIHSCWKYSGSQDRPWSRDPSGSFRVSRLMLASSDQLQMQVKAIVSLRECSACFSRGLILILFITKTTHNGKSYTNNHRNMLTNKTQFFQDFQSNQISTLKYKSSQKFSYLQHHPKSFGGAGWRGLGALAMPWPAHACAAGPEVSCVALGKPPSCLVPLFCICDTEIQGSFHIQIMIVQLLS